MPERETILVEREARIDAYLAQYTELSRTQAQRLIKSGDITLNERPTKPNATVRAGDTIEAFYPDPVETNVLPEAIPLDILYEDASLLVVNKPQGMVVHPAPGHESGTLVNALLYHAQDLSGVGGALRPGIVHRIDRMTSGLLVVAKNDEAHRALSLQFASHSAHRSYIALADGNLREDSGTINAPIGRDPKDRKRMAIVPNGREAITHWRVLERVMHHTLLYLELETGRTHQIRVHMAYAKHPIAGDDVYGAKKRAYGLEGQALHGCRLTFRHPVTDETMVFHAPLPNWFISALQKAEIPCETARLSYWITGEEPTGQEERL